MPNPIHGLTRYQAATDPQHTDPGLRGRTYAVSFDRVWLAAMGLAGGTLRGWAITNSDDQEGRIEAMATSLLRTVDDVEIRVTLDPNAQTRVDMRAAARKQRGDLGRNRRRIIRFLRRLDSQLEVTAGQVLAHYVVPAVEPSVAPAADASQGDSAPDGARPDGVRHDGAGPNGPAESTPDHPSVESGA